MAWLILNAGKDIENRTWRTPVSRPRADPREQGNDTCEYLDGEDVYCALADSAIDYPRFADIERGGIVGSVEIVDCVSESDSAWFKRTLRLCAE